MAGADAHQVALLEDCPMRRTLSAFVFTILLAGCGSLGSSLPYHAASSPEDSMGMTIEQYAVGRLPANHRSGAACPKPTSHAAVAATRLRHVSKRCAAR
jgi:hypothetical protein